MAFTKPSTKPFEKPFPAQDNWPQGRDNKSFQSSTEFVQVFNRNSSRRSPTDTTDAYRSVEKNKFLKMPFEKD